MKLNALIRVFLFVCEKLFNFYHTQDADHSHLHKPLTHTHKNANVKHKILLK